MSKLGNQADYDEGYADGLAGHRPPKRFYCHHYARGYHNGEYEREQSTLWAKVKRFFS